jgi:heat-inducible transcriptional repressor
VLKKAWQSMPESANIHFMTKELNQRSKDILENVVDIYTATGHPVGSKALSTVQKTTPLSPATIRNVMADLEEKGYLASPHTSAGRVPTEEGFRYYANSLVEVGKLKSNIKKELDLSIQEGVDFNTIVQNISKKIGQFTSCAGLVSSPRNDSDPLETIEFIRLKDARVLAVMVTKSGKIENRVIHVPDNIDEHTLNQSSRYLTEVVGGHTIPDARVAMMESLTEKRCEVNELMNNMMQAAETWGEAAVEDGALVVSGSQNLFQYPELVRDQLKDLFQVFEEKRLLMALLNEVNKGTGVHIFIGSDSQLEAAKDCSMITASYGTADKEIIGTLGVIGPMRMDYKRAINVVDYTSKLLSDVLEKQREKNK